LLHEVELCIFHRATPGKKVVLMVEFDPDAAAAPDSGIFGLPYAPQEARVVCIPVPFDATASYRRGAASGPAAILSASRQVDLFDIEIGHSYQVGIAMLPESRALHRLNTEARRAVDVVNATHGNAARGARRAEISKAIQRVNTIGARVNTWVYEHTAKHLRNQRISCIVGGDHSVSLGAIRAYAERFPGLGILHCDAHADLREAYGGFIFSHASIMANVLRLVPSVSRLVQVGVRDLGHNEYQTIRNNPGKIVTYFDASLQTDRHVGVPWIEHIKRIVSNLPDQVYISFDIDCLDPALCPGTGTPVPGGLQFAEATALIAAVAHSGRTIVGFDLCEVASAPGRRGPGNEWDGTVGARLLHKMIGWTLRSQGLIEASVP
jgi:agmatinase